MIPRSLSCLSLLLAWVASSSGAVIGTNISATEDAIIYFNSIVHDTCNGGPSGCNLNDPNYFAASNSALAAGTIPGEGTASSIVGAAVSPSAPFAIDSIATANVQNYGSYLLFNGSGTGSITADFSYSANPPSVTSSAEGFVTFGSGSFAFPSSTALTLTGNFTFGAPFSIGFQVGADAHATLGTAGNDFATISLTNLQFFDQLGHQIDPLSAVPEPSAAFPLGALLVGVAFLQCRRKTA